ncbi:MAG: hypothetical protein R3357_06030 [Burkholderiales bacterium]|nr:hypothetical protein [Burkholderiales bacterium]
MRSRPIELDPRFVPHSRPQRAAGWTRLVVLLLVIAGYVALACAQEGAVQVWLLVFAPLALIAAAMALRITGDSLAD